MYLYFTALGFVILMKYPFKQQYDCGQKSNLLNQFQIWTACALPLNRSSDASLLLQYLADIMWVFCALLKWTHCLTIEISLKSSGHVLSPSVESVNPAPRFFLPEKSPTVVVLPAVVVVGEQFASARTSSVVSYM